MIQSRSRISRWRPMSKRSSPRSLCLSPADTSTLIARGSRFHLVQRSTGFASTSTVEGGRMSAANTTNNNLQWDVLTIKRPGLSRDLPAGKEELMWVANSSTLIYVDPDPVLLDTFLTTHHSSTFLNSAL